MFALLFAADDVTELATCLHKCSMRLAHLQSVDFTCWQYNGCNQTRCQMSTWRFCFLFNFWEKSCFLISNM